MHTATATPVDESAVRSAIERRISARHVTASSQNCQLSLKLCWP